MRQFLTIASNAFMELVRQPVFLLLMTCSAVFNVFLATVPYFRFGDDRTLFKDSTLAVLLLAVLTYVNALSALLASRMAYDAYGDADTRAFGIFCGALALGHVAAGFINYFLRRPFVANAVLAVVIMATLAFVVIVNFTKTTNRFGYSPNEVDWRLVPEAILILFALLVLAGLALACSTRFAMIPTLAICTGIFLLGLMSDYLFGRLAEPVWMARLPAE